MSESTREITSKSYTVRLTPSEAAAFEDFYWSNRLKPAEALRTAIKNLLSTQPTEEKGK